jgi:hypothetical protein
MIKESTKRRVQKAPAKKRKRLSRSERIHRRRVLSLQRRGEKAQAVTARG